MYLTILVSVLVVFAMIMVIPLVINKRDNGMDLSNLVPENLSEWNTAGEDGLYDRESIFEYMNGAGEVYLSFAYQRLFVRRFTRGPDEEITIELYDMGNSSDAFGIFARGRTGEDIGIGNNSEYRSGYLLFWKDKYFIVVYTLAETDESKQAVFDLSRTIDNNIPETGTTPDIIALLPTDNLIENSVRYFHKYTDLNQHYFVADENILNLGVETDAVIANYTEGDDYSFLLIIRYHDDGLAEEGFGNFIDIYMPEGRESGIVQIEDGYWTSADRMDSYILAVFDAPTAERAELLLRAAGERIKGVGQ